MGIIDVQTSYFRLEGGLNLVSPALSVPPGMCIDAQNFVPEVTGGYKRVGGYERFDGRSSPSDQSYWIATVTTSGTFSVGNTITGATSGATAKILAVVSSTQLVVTRKTGTFVSETLNVSGNPQGTISAISENAASTPLLSATYTDLVQDEYRTSISAVPGSGSILGVWVYNDDVYAFRNNAGGTACVMHKATTGGWTTVTTPALSPSGSYEFVNYNFSGAAGGWKMYGVDGVNKAFQFDGTTFTQLTTGATPETPSHVTAHRNRLFVSVLGSMFHSAVGDPTTWSAVGGAGEIGVGDYITGMRPLPGDSSTGALAIFAENSTSILYGKTTSDWLLQPVAPDSGAMPNTHQYVSAMLALDQRGVTVLNASQAFGNFEQSTISRLVQPFLDARRNTAVGSSILRSQNHYRVYFSGGYGLVFQIEGGKNNGAMPIYYPNPVTAICSAETSVGEEVVFFGSTNGMVYEAEKGLSFDGADIESWIRLAFNPEKSPRVKKRFRRAVIEMDVPEYVALNFTYELDYGSYSLPIAISQVSEIVQTALDPGGGGFWDQFTWDDFTWDSQFINSPQFDITGSAKNVSLLFYQFDQLSQPFTLQGVTMHYDMRRLER